MNKTILIVSAASLPLQSCNNISENLREVYCRISQKKSIGLMAYDENSPLLIEGLANQIYLNKPRRLIFLDHLPHPGPLLAALVSRYKAQNFPDLFFHLNGSFVFAIRKWLAMDVLLKGKRVCFICPSERHSSFVSKLLNNGHNNISHAPFPVETSSYSFSAKVRHDWRRKLGLLPNEKALVYAGRLSHEKNLIGMLNWTEKLQHIFNSPLRFFLAGSLEEKLSESSRRFRNNWRTLLKSKFQMPIEELGILCKKELRGLYCAADAYVSLSLFAGEDFGMAPAEALCCGTPTILTDWGGYAQLGIMHAEGCHLIPVIQDNDRPTISSTHYGETMIEILTSDEGNDERLRRSRVARKHFSVNASAHKFQKIYSRSLPVFSGFSELCFLKKKNWSELLYREVSSSYIRSDNHP